MLKAQGAVEFRLRIVRVGMYMASICDWREVLHYVSWVVILLFDYLSHAEDKSTPK